MQWCYFTFTTKNRKSKSNFKPDGNAGKGEPHEAPFIQVSISGDLRNTTTKNEGLSRYKEMSCHMNIFSSRKLVSS